MLVLILRRDGQKKEIKITQKAAYWTISIVQIAKMGSYFQKKDIILVRKLFYKYL